MFDPSRNFTREHVPLSSAEWFWALSRKPANERVRGSFVVVVFGIGAWQVKMKQMAACSLRAATAHSSKWLN